MTSTALRHPPADRGAIVVRGAAALEVVRSAEFQRDWRALVERCPWASLMQAPVYVTTWYEQYADSHEPLIVSARGPDSRLSGLMTLAVCRRTGRITVAGAHQAEYQAWLAPPGPQRFICEALQALAELGFDRIEFTYLPNGAPLDWLAADERRWGRQTVVCPVSRPFLRLSDAAPMLDVLGKRSYRSRLKGLAATGPLEFRQLRTVEEFDAVAEDMAAYMDLRQGAIHGCCPFRDDRRKYAFHRALMQVPGSLHVTVLMSGARLVSVSIGTITGTIVSMAAIGHSPFVARHSPGRVHMLYLAQLLVAQGFTELDLTAGGDGYKERFATGHDTIHQVTVFLRRSAFLRHRANRTAAAVAKRAIAFAGIDRRKVSVALSGLKQRAAAGPGAATRALKRIAAGDLRRSNEVRLYRAAAAEVPRARREPTLRRNSIPDLLCYAPSARTQPSRNAFLSAAMSRLENGAAVYTRVDHGRLVEWVWVAAAVNDNPVPGGENAYEYPEGSAILWDHQREFTRDLDDAETLRAIVADVAADERVLYVYVPVLAGDGRSRRAVERAGLAYDGSLTRAKPFEVDRLRSEYAS